MHGDDQADRLAEMTPTQVVLKLDKSDISKVLWTNCAEIKIWNSQNEGTWSEAKQWKG